MDDFDTFYQQLESHNLLKEHGPSLVAEAREILQRDPEAKVAGTILLPEAKETANFRAFLEKVSGTALPPGTIVGLCPRALIEQYLDTIPSPTPWREESWQTQHTLPVLAATRDGMRVGWFGLGSTPNGA
jgi:hypothetical protein